MVGLVLIPSEGSPVAWLVSATAWGMDSWNFCHNAYNGHDFIQRKISLKYYIYYCKWIVMVLCNVIQGNIMYYVYIIVNGYMSHPLPTSVLKNKLSGMDTIECNMTS